MAEATGKAVVADEFTTEEMNLVGHYFYAAEVGEDNADYFVPLRWIKAVEESEALSSSCPQYLLLLTYKIVNVFN